MFKPPKPDGDRCLSVRISAWHGDLALQGLAHDVADSTIKPRHRFEVGLGPGRHPRPDASAVGNSGNRDHFRNRRNDFGLPRNRSDTGMYRTDSTPIRRLEQGLQVARTMSRGRGAPSAVRESTRRAITAFLNHSRTGDDNRSIEPIGEITKRLQVAAPCLISFKPWRSIMECLDPATARKPPIRTFPLAVEKTQEMDDHQDGSQDRSDA